ncbi:MAG: DUF4091 domain-containing protein [Actinobacteria bacterium]|nr:DUF4091 domain-containing protein [Actinomycetota bacterium]
MLSVGVDDDSITPSFAGERVAAQFAYRATSAQPFNRMECDVRVRTDLRDVRIYDVHLVPCEMPAYPDADDRYLLHSAGMIPDRLERIEPGRGRVRFLPHYWQTVWVEATIPADAPAGELALAIEFLEPDGSVHAAAQRSFLVEDSFPGSGRALAHSEWVHTDVLAEYYGVVMWSEQHWRLIENYVAPLKGWGVNTLLTPLLTPSLDVDPGRNRSACQLFEVEQRVGGYRFDFARLMRWLDIARRSGIETVEFTPLFRQWSVDAPSLVMAGDRVIFGGGVSRPGELEEYDEFLRQMLPALMDVLRATGWERSAFLHVADEPDEQHADAYRSAVSIVEAATGGALPIREATGSAALIRDGIVARPIVGLEAIDEVAAEWAYISCAHGRDVPNVFLAMTGMRTRMLGALLFHARVTGLLHWGYNFWKSQFSRRMIDPFLVTDADRAFPAGDPFLVYPGADGTPIPSIRLHYLRQAGDDYRLLTAAAEASSFEHVDALLVAAAGGSLGWTDYPEDPAFFERLRSIAAQAAQRVIV